MMPAWRRPRRRRKGARPGAGGFVVSVPPFAVSLHDCTAPITRLDSDETVILCAFCGSEYSHIANVFTRIGSDPAEAGIFRGTRAGGSVDSRRSCLVVVFEGECGHVFEWRIQQHKGNNFLSVVYAGDAGEVPAAPPSIWYRVAPIVRWLFGRFRT